MRWLLLCSLLLTLPGCAAIQKTRLANAQIRIKQLHAECLERSMHEEIDCSQFLGAGGLGTSRGTQYR